MKKMIITAMTFALVSTAAYSAANPVSETAAAVTAALTEFQAGYGADIQAQFKGVRAAAATNSGAKVKIYLSTDETIDYGCHRHDSSDPFECHEL